MMMNQWMEGGSLFLSVFFLQLIDFQMHIWNDFPKQRLQMKTMVCFCSSNLGSLLGTKIAWSGHFRVPAGAGNLPWLLKIPTCSIGTSYGLFSIYVTFLEGNWLGATPVFLHPESHCLNDLCLGDSNPSKATHWTSLEYSGPSMC